MESVAFGSQSPVFDEIIEEQIRVGIMRQRAQQEEQDRLDYEHTK